MSSSDEINRQISRALRLLALTALRGMKQREQVDLMDKTGYGQSEIAELLGSTPKAISVRLADARRARKGKKPAKGGKTRKSTKL